MESYLKEFYSEEITNLLNDNDNVSHFGMKVDLTHLQNHRPELYAPVITDVWKVIGEWDTALFEVQKQLAEEQSAFLEPDYQIKHNCHVRFTNLPQNDDFLNGAFPNTKHDGLFVQVKGSVVRMAQTRMLEFKREYICTVCKETFTFEADYKRLFVLEIPMGCRNPSGTCRGNLQPKNAYPKPEYCIDYQEIKIHKLFSGNNVPPSLDVTLENDLTDFCHPGDSVTICGTIENRFKLSNVLGKRIDIPMMMRAISICKEEEKFVAGKDVSEQILCARSQWQDAIDESGELNARDILISSICPELHGMCLLKLAVALSVCSGIIQKSSNGIETTRNYSHLLLVGDPSLGKSKLLKAASKISHRAIHTTGIGCSAAGLTAAAIKEEGEWQLEAGALVLADGGICCIDEFNLMRENDKISIHEAMEQQTISMAKAGLVCKLSTRCSVLAAANPKNLHSMSEFDGLSSVNIGISSPLLSRFDLVFILRDERDLEREIKIINHIFDSSSIIWNLERLQSHFMAVNNINPEITPIANEILRTYYNYCRADSYRDPSRTSFRLFDSLNRLAKAHAKLLFREYVNSIDAIVVIRLMESSWGFGRMISINILKSQLPLGPNENEIHEILTILNLMHLENNVLEEFEKSNKVFRSPSIAKKSNLKIVESNITSSSDDDNTNHKNDLSFHQWNNKSPLKRSSENDSSILNIHDLERNFGYHKNLKKIKKSELLKEENNQDTEKIEDYSQKTQTSSNTDSGSQSHSSEELNAKVSKMPNVSFDISDFNDEDFELDFNFECPKNKNNVHTISDKVQNELICSTQKPLNSPNLGKCQDHSFNTSKSSPLHKNHEQSSPLHRKSMVSSPSYLKSKQEQTSTSRGSSESLNDRLNSKTVSPVTLNKLAMFKNPNYVERNEIDEFESGRAESNLEPSKPISITQSSKLSSVSGNDDDSAYNTMPTPVNNFGLSFKFKIKEEDLSCLDFDV